MKMWVLITWLLIFVAARHLPSLRQRLTRQEPILSVQKHEANGVSYRKATDAPTRSIVFTYDVSVQVTDTVLVGRYQSAIDYLPNTWIEGSSVEISSDKHRMYLKGPSAEDFELSILSRRPLRKGK